MQQPLSSQPVVPKGTALIVDDNARYGGMLTRFVQSLGLFCVLAEDGADALAWLEANPRPDVILCDIQMPRMDGFELLAELKSRGSDVPVIIVSGVDDRESMRRATNLGAVGYVTKPVIVDQLRERIGKLTLRPPL